MIGQLALTGWDIEAIASLLRHIEKHALWELIGVETDNIPMRGDESLIAAAPELLAACEAVLEIYRDECRYDHHGLCQEHHLRRNAEGYPECEVKLLKDAIAKAKGE